MTIVPTDLTSANGLVIAYFGSSVEVEGADGKIYQCHLRRNQPLPVVGDRVIWQQSPDKGGRVERILPRQSLLARGDYRGQQKPLAANVDQIIIVMAPPPIFSTYLVDRYLTAATLLNIDAVIAVNKADLMNTAARASLETMLMPYREMGYPVIVCSLKEKEKLVELTAQLSHRTSVLLGPSGVGKSSIIGHLVKEDIRTTAVSNKGAGKHTTTGTRLYHLPEQGALIDSPGVRDFNLWPYTVSELQHGFREFIPYLKNCRFRDCRHIAEPGCNLLEALAAGKINQQRFENYLSLLKAAK